MTSQNKTERRKSKSEEKSGSECQLGCESSDLQISHAIFVMNIKIMIEKNVCIMNSNMKTDIEFHPE